MDMFSVYCVAVVVALASVAVQIKKNWIFHKIKYIHISHRFTYKLCLVGFQYMRLFKKKPIQTNSNLSKICSRKRLEIKNEFQTK